MGLKSVESLLGYQYHTYTYVLRTYTPHFSTAGVFDPSNAAIHVAQNALNFFGSSAMW